MPTTTRIPLLNSYRFSIYEQQTAGDRRKRLAVASMLIVKFKFDKRYMT